MNLIRFSAFGLWLAASLIQASEAEPLGEPTPEIRVSVSTPAYFYTHSLGAGGTGEMRFYVRLMNSVNAAPPVTVQTTLPDGISFVNHANSGWDCSATGQDLTCQSLVGLTTSARERNVRIRIDVAGDIPVPGESTVRLLREHASLPPADPDNCESVFGSGPVYSDTGCVERVVEHRESRIWFETSGWNHSPAVFLAGSTENVINTLVRSEGFQAAHQPVNARFLLPPGFLFNRGGPNGTWSCSAEPATPQGQSVDCLYVLNSYNITAGPWLRVDMAPDVPVPGPHTIIAHVGNSYQPPPDDLFDCLDTDPPAGCSAYSIGTGTPPQAHMDIVAISQQPLAFTPDGSGRVQIDYNNIGQASAGTISLEVALPPGLSFTHAGTASPAASCSASGDPADGQQVSCSMGAGLSVGQTGHVNLHADIAWAGYLEAPITAEIGDSSRPGPGLEACLLDPNPTGCGQSSIRVTDSLFCDRYEDPTAGCRPLDNGLR